jgi:hypothetical protein
MLRDGGLAATKDQGLTRNTYYEDINILDDKVIDEYIDDKIGTAKLITTFKASEGQSQAERWELLQNLCPALCTEKERWFDKESGKSKKCEKYCAVSEICGRIS